MSSLDWPTTFITALFSLLVGVILHAMEDQVKFYSNRLTGWKPRATEKPSQIRDWTNATEMALLNFKKQNSFSWLKNDLKIESSSQPVKGEKTVEVVVVKRLLESNSAPEERYELVFDRSGELRKITRKFGGQASIPIALNMSQPAIKDVDEPSLNNSEDISFREKNIAQLIKTGSSVSYFAIRFFLLWVAFYLPLFFFLGFKSTISLDSIKIIGWFSNAVIPIRSLGIPALLLTFGSYVPALLFTDYISLFLAKYLNNYMAIKPLTLTSIRFIITIIFSFMVSGVVTYFISDLPLCCSCSLWPLIIVIIILAVATGIFSSGVMNE